MRSALWVHRANNAMTLLFLLCIHCPVIDTNLTAAAPLHLEVVAPRIKRFLTEYFSPAEDPCWPNRAARPDTADCHCPSLRFNLQQKPPCLRGHCHNFRRWMPMARGGIVAWRQCRWKVGVRAERIVEGRCADASDVLSSLEAVRAAAK